MVGGDDPLALPVVPVAGTGNCSAHATLFPRWRDEAVARRLGDDLGRAFAVLALPKRTDHTKEEPDGDA